jgi:signal peptidase II
MTNGWVRSPKLRRFGIGLLASSFVLALDQASKWLMIELLTSPPRFIPVTPFFNLVLGFNRGISFGLLDNLGSWGPMMLSFLAAIIICFLFLWLWKTEHLWDGTAISLIIGGALGNLLDRLRVGAVTDFLDIYVGPYHWPAFNLADTGIVIGVGILVVQSIFPTGKTTQNDAGKNS